MPKFRVLAPLIAIAVTAGCTSGSNDAGPNDLPAQDNLSLVTYWNENPQFAPPEVIGAVVLLDEEHTGTHTFALPDASQWATLSAGVSCGAADSASWSVTFDDELGKEQLWVGSGCGGSGSALGSFQTADLGVPDAVTVTVAEGVHYSVGIWGTELPT